MIFQKYLANADITTLLDKLVAIHKLINPEVDVKSQIEGYLTLIINFLHIEARPRSEIIVVEASADLDETWDGCVRIHGTGAFHGRMLDIYYWENNLNISDLVGMEVQTKYSLEDTCAYIIYELTFCGFNPEDFGDIEGAK